MAVGSIRKKWKVRRSNGLNLSVLDRVAYNTGQGRSALAIYARSALKCRKYQP